MLAKPDLVLIDEGTSGMDIVAEGRLMRLAVSRNVTLISVGRSLSLVSYHDNVLHIYRGINRIASRGSLVCVSDFVKIFFEYINCVLA